MRRELHTAGSQSPNQPYRRLEPHATGELEAGDKVVVPPPKMTSEVEERLSHKGKDYDVKDFDLCLKDQPTQ